MARFVCYQTLSVLLFPFFKILEDCFSASHKGSGEHGLENLFGG